jgi:transposase
MKKKDQEIENSLKSAREFLETDKSLSPAAKVIFELLLSLVVELLQTIKELNTKLNLNSKNSSKPPSSDNFPKGGNSKKGRGRKPGGQKGRKGSTLKKVSNPDKTKDHYPKGKCRCGNDLSELTSTGHTSRQVWDLIIQTMITEHRAHQVQCSCGEVHNANFPSGVNNHTQYGDTVKAIATYFSQYQLIPFERAKEMFKDIFNLDLSAGTVCNANSSLSDKLKNFDKKVKEALVASEVNHSDETYINITGKNNYLHVLSNEFFTLLYPHKKRGRDAMNEMEVLPNFKGKLIHDFYKPYLKYECEHLFCGSHLIRELIFSEEQEEQHWARKMRQLLQVSNYLRNKGRLYEDRVDKIEEWYSEVLLMGQKESPPPERKETKRKGRVSLFKNDKKSKSRCLLERFRDYREGILKFIHDPTVPFTNNLGERDLRMAKVHQKISGCFRSMDGARTYAQIRSYISTVKKQGLNVMKGITDAFSSSDSTLNQIFG